MSPRLQRVFPDDDYSFPMRFERGAPTDFFAPTDQNARLLAERRDWLRTDAETYAALLPVGEVLLSEAVECARAWNGFSPAARAPETGALNGWSQLVALGEFWEPDFLLLKADAEGEIRLHGGCVCFPSAWRLREKIGQPIEFIHDVVPGLNQAIGPAIQKFLANLKPGIAWERSNWGLSRSPELNQHPDRGLPRLAVTVDPTEVWLRVEHQALVALPHSGGILFGIRIEVQPLAHVKADPELARRLARALATMPEPMAAYKGISAARPRLLELLIG